MLEKASRPVEAEFWVAVHLGWFGRLARRSGDRGVLTQEIDRVVDVDP